MPRSECSNSELVDASESEFAPGSDSCPESRVLHSVAPVSSWWSAFSWIRGFHTRLRALINHVETWVKLSPAMCVVKENVSEQKNFEFPHWQFLPESLSCRQQQSFSKTEAGSSTTGCAVNLDGKAVQELTAAKITQARDATIPGRGNGVTCAVSKLGLHLVAGKWMAHVGIEPLLEDVGGNLGVVVLWSIVAGLFLSLGFVLR